MCRAGGAAYLGVKRRVLDRTVEEDPDVVLDHEVLHVCVLVLLVDLLRELPAAAPSLVSLLNSLLMATSAPRATETSEGTLL